MVVAAAVVVASFGVSVRPAISAAASGDIGYEDQSFSGTSEPTGTKRAESVLWWNDGSWWGSLWDTTSQDFHIFRLDLSTQTWIDTGVTLDPRADTHSDVLWDGSHLYVASHRFVDDELPAASGYPSYLYRFSYDPIAKRYSLDSGFPVQINNYKTETLVIDKDSTGKLWATWQQNNTIFLNRTLNGDDRQWGTPFALPASATSVTVDDNSAVIAFGGDSIGVMWSNQTTSNDAMYFAVHVDGQPETVWGAARTAIQGPNTADDHINLKSLQVDSSGRVYAAVKTSFTNSSQPQIMLLVRDRSTGDWTSYPIARVSDCPNRVIVLIDEENRVLHTFFSAPAPPAFACNSSGGAIYQKTSPLDAIAFPIGAGTPVILDADSAYVHNVSSTKQNVTSRTGIVVLARNSRTARYWHHYEAISPSNPPPPPTADFSGTPTSGTAPLTVAFTDSSTGSPTSWSWTFGDGATSTAQNPTHTYSAAGTSTVALTVTNAGGSDTLTRPGYISATSPPPDFTLTASPSKQTVVRGGSTSYTIGVSAVNGFSGSVSLTLTGLPANSSSAFSANPVSVPAANTSTLTVTTSSSTKQGSYTLTVSASSGSLLHSTTVVLQVKPK
jgi:PKD repeat protein